MYPISDLSYLLPDHTQDRFMAIVLGVGFVASFVMALVSLARHGRKIDTTGRNRFLRVVLRLYGSALTTSAFYGLLAASAITGYAALSAFGPTVLTCTLFWSDALLLLVMACRVMRKWRYVPRGRGFIALLSALTGMTAAVMVASMMTSTVTFNMMAGEVTPTVSFMDQLTVAAGGTFCALLAALAVTAFVVGIKRLIVAKVDDAIAHPPIEQPTSPVQSTNRS